MQIKDIKRGLCFNRVTRSGRLTCNLVIAVSDFNATYVSVERFIKYEFIDGCKFAGEIWNGMSACIDNIRATPITTFMKEANNNTIVPVGYLSQKQMVKIVTAVTDYLSGNLVFSNAMIKHKFEIDDGDDSAGHNPNKEEDKSRMYDNDINSANSNDHYDPNVTVTTYNSGNNDINPAPQVENVETPQTNNDVEEKQTDEEPPIEVSNETVTEEPSNAEETNEELNVTEENHDESETTQEEVKEEQEQPAENFPDTQAVPAELIPPVEPVNQNLEEDNGDRVSGVAIIKNKNPKTPAEAISEYIPVEINPVIGEKWYDLTADCNNKIDDPKKNKKDYPAKKSKKNKKDNSSTSEVDLFRHFYSESEVRVIAISTIKTIMSKYRVSNSIAQMLCKNARKIMNIDSQTKVIENNYVEFFDEGYTPEELVEVLGDDAKYGIMKSYENYIISKNSTTSRSDIEAKYKEIVDNGRDNIAFIDQVYKMTYADIAKMEKCNKYSAEKAKFIIEEYLFSRYIQYYIGCDYTTTADDFKDDEAALAVFNKAIQLKDVVIRSFRSHVDIANGIKPIPKNVPEEDKEFYMAIIINRVCRYNRSGKNAIFTDTQKSIIESVGKKFSRKTTSMAFMMAKYNSVGNCINRKRSQIKNSAKKEASSTASNTAVDEALAATV